MSMPSGAATPTGSARSRTRFPSRPRRLPLAKPTGLITAASHDSVLLSWDDPGDDTITGYQVLRGPDADNLAALADNTGSATSSYTDSAVAAEKTYVYAVRGRNARGLSPQSDPVTATTLAAPGGGRAADLSPGASPSGIYSGRERPGYKRLELPRR